MSTTRPVRAIVGARTSVFNDDKVSHIAQAETAERYCRANGWEIVDRFQDLGVSATISPWDRESLGPFLAPERAGTYDAIVWSKVDRAFRSAKDAADTAAWAEQNHKVLVFADDSIVLDYRQDPNSMAGMMSKMFLMLSSMFGEMELRRFRQRAADTHRTLKTQDRWASGVPPLGYRTIAHPSGHGKTLAPDEKGRELLHWMAERLLTGWSFTKIANELNERREMTNMAKAQGKFKNWTTDNVKRALTTLRTQGYKMSDGEPVLDEHGEMVRIADPTFDEETWERVQQVAAERTMSGKRRAVSENPLLGVGYCGECGASLTRKDRGRGNVYYRCGRTPVSCRGVGIRTDEAEQMVAEVLTSVIGHLQVTRQVFVAGEDSSRELDKINATIARLRRESDAGLITTEADEAEYLDRMRALVGRRDALSATPTRASGWVTEYDQETYGDQYGRLDATGRRDLLRASGVRLYVSAGELPSIVLPDALEQRLSLPEGSVNWSGGVLAETDTSNPPPFWPEGALTPRSEGEWL